MYYVDATPEESSKTRPQYDGANGIVAEKLVGEPQDTTYVKSKNLP